MSLCTGSEPGTRPQQQALERPVPGFYILYLPGAPADAAQYVRPCNANIQFPPGDLDGSWVSGAQITLLPRSSRRLESEVSAIVSSQRPTAPVPNPFFPLFSCLSPPLPFLPRQATWPYFVPCRAPSSTFHLDPQFIPRTGPFFLSDLVPTASTATHLCSQSSHATEPVCNRPHPIAVEFFRNRRPGLTGRIVAHPGCTVP